jgi:hypothetical protein
MVDSEVPQVVTLTGTGFGSSSGTVNVTLSGAGTPFILGTVSSLTVTGTIINPTTVTFISPISAVLTDLAADIMLDFASGVTATANGLLLIKAPTVTAASPDNVASEIPSAITVTGTGFAGGTPTVSFVATAGTPFLGGTASTMGCAGVTLVNSTTFTCTTPRAGVRLDTSAKIQVQLTGGLNPTSVAPVITFNAPAVTS